MADKDNAVMIPMYFIGVHYPPTKSLTYNVKGHIYQPQTKDGKIVVGGLMQVNEHDVKALKDKSLVYKRGEGFFETFTTDPNIAAAVRTRYENGVLVGVSARMTLAQANALLTPEENKQAIIESLTTDELKAQLNKLLGGDPNSFIDSKDESVDKQPEKQVEEKVSAPKNGKRKPATDGEVVDELLK